MEAAVVNVECRCVDRTIASSSSEYIEFFILSLAIKTNSFVQYKINKIIF